MGGICRPSAFRSPRRLLSFLATEAMVLGVIFVLCLGAGLVAVRNIDHFSSTRTLFFIALGIAIAIAGVWNGIMVLRGCNLKTLALLLDEVDRHNDVLHAVQVMDELGAVQSSSLRLPNRDEVILALRATRESLVCALMTEKILRRHKRLMLRRQELFVNIEMNLATLQSLTINNQAQEYHQLLNEALEIGLAVHRELRS